MARHKINRPHSQAPAALPTNDPTTQPNGPGVSTIVERIGQGDIIRTRGGTLGIIPEAERRISMHNLVSSGGIGRSAVPHEEEEAPQRFTLIGGPRDPSGKVTFMYEGCRTSVAIGKVFSSTCYDMSLLRRQGLIFEELRQEESPSDVEELIPTEEETALDASA